MQRLDTAIAALRGGARGRTPGPGGPAGEPRYVDTIEAILDQTSRQPLRPRDILARLKAEGAGVRGQRPHTTLWNTLSSSPRSVKMQGGWGLRKWIEAENGA